MALGFYLLNYQLCFMSGVKMSNVKLKVRTLFISNLISLYADKCDGPDTCYNHGACLGTPRKCICDVGYQLTGYYGNHCEG